MLWFALLMQRYSMVLDSYHTWCGRVTDKDEAVRANLGKYRVDFFFGGWVRCDELYTTGAVLYGTGTSTVSERKELKRCVLLASLL